jgi:lysyl-tRNA synthetase class 2
VVLLAASSLAHVLKGLDVEEGIATALLAYLLLLTRRVFVASPDPAWRRALLKTLPVVLVVDVAYGFAGLYLHRPLIRPHLTAWLAGRETTSRLVGASGPLQVAGHFGRWFPTSITVLGGLSLLILLGVLLAPSRSTDKASEPDRAAARRLLARDDGDTLDPFALRHDKSYVFSADRRAAVAYRGVNGVGLASGDPVGHPDAFVDALTRFVALCDQRGWRPAVIGAREERASVYAQVGLKSRYIGDEAILDVASFSLEGRPMRPVRQAVSRTKNFGVTTEYHHEGELDPTLRQALQGIAERARAGAIERGFSMALDGLLSGRDADCLLVVSRDRLGTPIAFQRYVPCQAGAGLSLDAMRRDPEAPNGVNERMIVETVEWARARNIDTVSLNFAAFKNLVADEARLGPLQSAEAWLIRRLNPYFQIESLYRFNTKFHPRWVPRALMYRTAGDIVPVAVAALSAEAFLPFDRRRPAA